MQLTLPTVFLTVRPTHLLRWRQSDRSRGRRTTSPAGRRVPGPPGPLAACSSGRRCSTAAPPSSRRGRAACGTCSGPAPRPRSSGCTGACTRCAWSRPCRTQICKRKRKKVCNKVRKKKTLQTQVIKNREAWKIKNIAKKFINGVTIYFIFIWKCLKFLAV